MVEGLGVSQIFALLPRYLREMGVAERRAARVRRAVQRADLRRRRRRSSRCGASGPTSTAARRSSSGARSSRRSVFAGVALSREPWQLALSMLLIGFQLGNTGRDAGRRSATSRPRAATRHDRSRSSGRRGRSGSRSGRCSRASSSTASAGPCRGSSGSRRCCRSGPRCSSRSARGRSGPRSSRRAGSSTSPSGRSRGVLADPAVRRIFLIFGVAYPGHPDDAGRTSRSSSRASPASGPGSRRRSGWSSGRRRSSGRSSRRSAGALGDRVGFRPVLVAALGGAGVVLLLMPLVPAVPVARGPRRRARRVHGDGQRDGLRPARDRGARRSAGRRRSTSSTCRSTPRGSSGRRSAPSSPRRPASRGRSSWAARSSCVGAVGDRAPATEPCRGARRDAEVASPPIAEA